MLVILGGLPGVGKSALADALAPPLGAVVISVDPIEAAIVRSGIEQSFETGLAAYLIGAVIAEKQLQLGHTVIADAANYLEAGRQIWLDSAASAGVRTRIIEIVCSDESEHRLRLETRERDLGSFRVPSWQDVLVRRAETEPWRQDHFVLDALAPVGVNVEAALRFLSE